MSQLKCNTVNVGGDTLTDGVIKHSTYGSPDVDTGNKITLKGNGTIVVDGDTTFSGKVKVAGTEIVQDGTTTRAIDSTNSPEDAGRIIYKRSGQPATFTIGTMPQGTQVVIINTQSSSNITLTLASAGMEFHLAGGSGPSNGDITMANVSSIATLTWILEDEIFVTGVGLS